MRDVPNTRKINKGGDWWKRRGPQQTETKQIKRKLGETAVAGDVSRCARKGTSALMAFIEREIGAATKWRLSIETGDTITEREE